MSIDPDDRGGRSPTEPARVRPTPTSAASRGAATGLETEAIGAISAYAFDEDPFDDATLERGQAFAVTAAPSSSPTPRSGAATPAR